MASASAFAACSPSTMSSFAVPAGLDLRGHRSERRGQDHACSTSSPACSRPTRVRSPSPVSAIDGLRPDEICRRGIGRTFQLVRPFPALSVEDNVIVGAMLHRPDLAAARARAHEVLAPARPVRQARPTGLGADAAGSQAARSRARARDRSAAPAARRGDGGPAAGRDRPHGRDPAPRSIARPG